MQTTRTFMLDGVKYSVKRLGATAVEVDTLEDNIPCRVFLGAYDGLNLIPTRKYQNADADLRASAEIALMRIPFITEAWFVDDTGYEMEEAFAELVK